MKIVASALAFCVALALAAPSLAADAKDAKTNKDKLVGVWEVIKSENAPPGATVEFTKDGKMIVIVKDGDKTEKVEGTYKLDKDSITSKLKFGDKENEETVTITKLTDTELVVKDAKGKVDEFKKKK